LNGKGVAQDYAKAAEWFAKAAKQGHGGAQHNLAICYLNGYGVAQDFEKAAEWYAKAAEQNLALAQLCLGSCYESGKGVAQDLKKAAELTKKRQSKGTQPLKVVWAVYTILGKEWRRI